MNIPTLLDAGLVTDVKTPPALDKRLIRAFFVALYIGTYGCGIMMLGVVNDAIGCNDISEFRSAATNIAVIRSGFLSDLLHTETVHIDEARSYNTALKVDSCQVTVRSALTGAR